jgi:hypothetical protein
MYVYLFVALFAAAVSGVGIWKVQGWRHDSQERERIEHEAEVRRQNERAVDVAAEGHEKDKARIRTVTKEVTREVEKIVREPFYVDGGMCLDPAGLRAVETAVRGTATTSLAPGAVPGPGPAR